MAGKMYVRNNGDRFLTVRPGGSSHEVVTTSLCFGRHCSVLILVIISTKFHPENFPNSRNENSVNL